MRPLPGLGLTKVTAYLTLLGAETTMLTEISPIMQILKPQNNSASSTCEFSSKRLLKMLPFLGYNSQKRAQAL